MRIFSILYKLYKPGSSTKQFSPKLVKNFGFQIPKLTYNARHTHLTYATNTKK